MFSINTMSVSGFCVSCASSHCLRVVRMCGARRRHVVRASGSCCVARVVVCRSRASCVLFAHVVARLSSVSRVSVMCVIWRLRVIINSLPLINTRVSDVSSSSHIC